MRQPYLSVFEKGFFFEDEEAELAAFTGTGAGLLEGAVRGLLAAAAALFIERLIAAMAAAPAAEEHSVSTPKQNGFSTSESNATTEFDNVLDMLTVKPPPRSASPGDIPDEEL